MTSIQQIQDKTFDSFLSSSKKDQRDFMDSINIHELKEINNRSLLKKFIAMKLLMEARHAAEDKSLFNLTAQFRNVLAPFAPRLRLGADYGDNDPAGRELLRDKRHLYGDVDDGEEDKKDASSNGYRLFHESQMGRNKWQRKIFNLGVDDANNGIVIKHIKTCKSRCNGSLS